MQPAAIAADLAPCQPGAVTVTRQGCFGSEVFSSEALEVLAVIRDLAEKRRECISCRMAFFTQACQAIRKDEDIIAQTRKIPPKRQLPKDTWRKMPHEKD